MCVSEHERECPPCRRARIASSAAAERPACTGGLRGGNPNPAEMPAAVDRELEAFLDELAREGEEFFEQCNQEEEEARQRERELDALFEDEEDNDSSGDYMDVGSKAEP